MSANYSTPTASLADGLSPLRGLQKLGSKYVALNRRSALLGLSALGASTALPARADQVFRGKTVRLVTGYGPGSPADTVARLIGPRLGELVGGTFIADPRPGAGERVAAQVVATSPPDGTTMLMMTGGQAVVAASDPNLQYNILRDFSYISMLVYYPLLLVTATRSKYANLAELLEDARKNPGKRSYASAGVGTTTHLAMELMLRQAKVDMLHVPYSSARSLADTQSGLVDVLCSVVSSTKSLMQAGELRALAVTSKERSELTPDVPSVSETVPGVDVTTWLAMAVPSATPAATVTALASAVKTVIAEPAIREKCLALALIPRTNTPDEMRARVAADIEKWKPFEQLVR